MCAGGLTSRTKELSSMTAERNQYRSEAAEAGRQADKLTQRLSAMPKASLSQSLSLDPWCTDYMHCIHMPNSLPNV